MNSTMRARSAPAPPKENKKAVAVAAKAITKKVTEDLKKKLQKAEAKQAKAKKAVKTAEAKADAKSAEAATNATKKGKSPAEAKVKARVVASKVKAKAKAKAKDASNEVKDLKAEIKKVKAVKKECKGSSACVANGMAKVEKAEKTRSTVKVQKKVAAEKAKMKKDPVKYAAKRASRYAIKMKKAGIPTKPSSDRVARIAKACGKDANCVKYASMRAAEAMRRQYIAARHACRGKAKCIQHRIKMQAKRSAYMLKKFEKGCRGKKGS